MHTDFIDPENLVNYVAFWVRKLINIANELSIHKTNQAAH